MAANSGLKTTWGDVQNELLPVLGSFGRSKLRYWENKRGITSAALKDAVTHKIYTFKPDSLKPLITPRMTDWPFPKEFKFEEHFRKEIMNMSGGLPLAYALHQYVEEQGSVPTWKEAVAYLNGPAEDIFAVPAFQLLAEGYDSQGNRLKDKYTKDEWKEGIRCRLGNAYISFIRELDFVSRMHHDHGIPVRMHPMADAVLKVDFWYGKYNICLYLENDYRQRKSSPDNPYRIDVPFPRRGGPWNKVKTVTEREMLKLVAILRSGGGGAAPMELHTGAENNAWMPGSGSNRQFGNQSPASYL